LEIVKRFDYALGRKVGADADIVNPFLKKN
jgi:hypothetical protein